MDRHRRDVGSAFCRRYGIKTLVYAEPYDAIEDAIARETALTAWQRAWKDTLIDTAHPAGKDLFDRIA